MAQQVAVSIRLTTAPLHVKKGSPLSWAALQTPELAVPYFFNPNHPRFPVVCRKIAYQLTYVHLKLLSWRARCITRPNPGTYPTREMQCTHGNGRAIPAIRECELQLADTDLCASSVSEMS